VGWPLASSSASPRPSGPRSIPNGRSWPGIWPFWRCWCCARAGSFPAQASEACMGLRRQIVVWRDQLVSGRVAVRVLDRAERRVKLASLALRRVRRRSERVLDAGLRQAQTQVPRVVAAVRVQAKTWHERSSRVAAHWGAAVAASARNARLREGPLAPLAKAAGEWVGSIRRRESTQGGRYRIEVATPLSRHIGLAGVGLTALLV